MTAALQLSQERVTLLDPADVQRYLLTHDWDEDRIASSAKVGAFRYRPSPEITVLVPRDRKFSDYALRVGDLLQTLAVIERRKAWEVLEDLLASRQTPPRNGDLGGTPESPKADRSRRSR
jgi:hypothetical protein